MRQLPRLVMIALVAAAVATIIVQRERIRQIDRALLAAQIRDAIQSRFDRSGGDPALSDAETLQEDLDDAVADTEAAAENV